MTRIGPLDNPERGSVLETPGGSVYARVTTQEPAMSQLRSDNPRAETISVNRTLGWAVGILGFVASTAAVAGVAALWGQGQSITRMEANQEAMTKQIDALATTVSQSAQGRYTASEAISANTEMVKTINSMRDAWSKSFETVMLSNNRLNSDLSDMRVKVATLEARAKP